ncbi:MAG TPA: hypothetical protein VLI71_16810 [Gammaproteobacteria bacterium]|nr:hypothetical protein [Gammaproteobacteria bacterium]
MRRAAFLAAALAVATPLLLAQPTPQPAGPPPTARAAAPIDLTGQWVAIVNEDWRWRMVTPPKGDYASVPLNDEGRRVADQWDPSQDGACEAYGAAALLRMPTRLRIRWDGDARLVLETDAGRQVRNLDFGAPAAASAPSLQGQSTAKWVTPPRPTGGPGLAGAGGGGAPRAGGYLEVRTTSLSPGWLRRNGVPYSADAIVTEYFARFATPNGAEWLMVTTIVDDPRYLTQRFIVSNHFRKEAEGGRWSPRACGAGS